MTEFISRNHGHSCFEVIIRTTDEEHYKQSVGFARRLIDQAKPQTNADRIRAMSDKELALFLHYFNKRICEHCAYERKCTSKCIGGVRDWLQQPAEVE